jgi:hypothetical protein
VLAVFGLAAGRRAVTALCRRRSELVETFRVTFLASQRAQLPKSATELRRLGDALSGEAADYRLADPGSAGSPGLARRLDELSEFLPGRIERQVSSELSEVMRRWRDEVREPLGHVEIGEEALDRLAEQFVRQMSSPIGRVVGDSVSEAESRLAAGLRRVVEESVAGPSLDPFTGVMVVGTGRREGTGSAESPIGPGRTPGSVRVDDGVELNVFVTLRGDQHAANMGPERGGPEDDYIALQPVTIPGTPTGHPVEFELVVDSPTLRPTPYRRRITVAPNARSRESVSLGIPETGDHEAWLQLYQTGRLIEVVVLPIHAGTDRANSG